MWPFQITISTAKKKNVFLKALAKVMHYRWSVEVISVNSND